MPWTRTFGRCARPGVCGALVGNGAAPNAFCVAGIPLQAGPPPWLLRMRMQGSNWELLGKAASITIPTLVVMALLVGIFAAKFYNSGANTFLEMPKGPDDTAKLYQRAPE